MEVLSMTNNTQYKTLVNEWLSAKKPMITASTYANFVLIAENHLIPYFGKCKIGTITESDIQRYILYLYEEGRLDKKGGLTVKTIRDVVLVLKLSMEYAYKEKTIPLLNWDLIEYPKDNTTHRVISLSKEEEQDLIQCIYLDMNRKSAGILVCLMTGLRIGELCGLKMSDISLAEKTISVNRTVQRIYDKRKCVSRINVGLPKTKSSVRTIPYPTLLGKILEKYYAENPEVYFLTGKTKPTEPRTYRQYFERFLKRNNLPKIKFHELRHTFAVRAIEIPEFDIKSLSEILGHKNVSFTLNVYGSANIQQKVKCMNLLNDLL
jgi:integrase